MENIYEPTEDGQLPDMVEMIFIGCDNCIRDYKPIHHLGPTLEKIDTLFKLLAIVEEYWRVDAKGDEKIKKYVLDCINEKEIQLTTFKNSIL